ncbi:MAG: hypothetical protein IJL63_05575 [Clostridia bacterium]|nr:hypothetical protein [Clostridia bacterium]
MSKKNNIFSLLFNAANLILVAVSVIGFFVSTGSGNMQVAGAKCFMFFTIDSNVLAALASLFMCVFCLKHLKDGKTDVPKWLSLFKFVGTTAVTVTLLTVIFFLGPTMGYGLMFAGSSLYLHLINPLLCIISYTCFEKSEKLPLKYSLLGILPTAVYGAVYVAMVVFTGKWPDFYGFNTGGFWYVSLPVMLAATYLFAFCLWQIHKKVSKNIIEDTEK